MARVPTVKAQTFLGLCLSSAVSVECPICMGSSEVLQVTRDLNDDVRRLLTATTFSLTFTQPEVRPERSSDEILKMNGFQLGT